MSAKHTFSGTIYRASLETRNFSFEVAAAGEDNAVAFLKRGLERHAMTYGLARDWYAFDDIVIQKIALGACYRDGVEI